MKLNISYDNNCNFLDAFIFKGVDLENVRVGTVDLPNVLSAKNAHISFDYKFLLSKGGVVLNCVMYKPVISISNNTNGAETVTKFLPSDLLSAISIDGKIVLETIEFNVLLYDVFAEILKLKISSKDLTILLNGKISNKGSVQIHLKSNFSPSLGKLLPQEVAGFLEETQDGGYFLEIDFKNDPVRKAFTIDSPRLKFSIGK